MIDPVLRPLTTSLLLALLLLVRVEEASSQAGKVVVLQNADSLIGRVIEGKMSANSSGMSAFCKGMCASPAIAACSSSSAGGSIWSGTSW